MGHRKFTPEGKVIPDPSLEPFTAREGARIKETQRQLEILERSALLRRSKEKGERIRDKVRLGSR